MWLPSPCSARTSLSCCAVGTEGAQKGPTDASQEGIQGQSCDGRGTLCSLSQLLPTHQTQPIPRGCSQSHHQPVPHCQGNQTPPESSWFKGLWVSNMLALLNDHPLSSASLERVPSPGPPAPGCPQMHPSGGPALSLDPETGAGQALSPQAARPQSRGLRATLPVSPSLSVALDACLIQLNK